MNELYTQLKTFGHVRSNELMAKHTTFKIGGPVDFFVTVEETEKIVALLQFLDGEGVAYFVVGGGSNMLVRDEGFRGVAVQMKNATLKIENSKIIADAGCITVDVAQKSTAAGLTGFEWGVGVPGTIGGAIRGNAGSFVPSPADGTLMGGEMHTVVESVEVYRDGERLTLAKSECAFGYRDSLFKHTTDIILGATLVLRPAIDLEGRKQMLEFFHYRNKTQPQGYGSIGCIFKNFEILNPKQIPNSKLEIPNEFLEKGKIPAGWLVEKAGMKGAVCGNIMVSDKHGNFMLNKGGATAADVLALIEQVKQKVYDKSGIEIEEEIQII